MQVRIHLDELTSRDNQSELKIKLCLNFNRNFVQVLFSLFFMSCIYLGISTWLFSVFLYVYVFLMSSDLNVSNNLFHHHLLWEKNMCLIEFEIEFSQIEIILRVYNL